MPDQMEGFMKGLVLGGLAGAVIGVLFAPQSGRKTREDIDRKAKKLLSKTAEEYEAALRKGGKAYESAAKQLRHLESATKEKVGEMKESVEELTERGKEAFHDTKGQLTKAMDAAVQAIR